MCLVTVCKTSLAWDGSGSQPPLSAAMTQEEYTGDEARKRSTEWIGNQAMSTCFVGSAS